MTEYTSELVEFKVIGADTSKLEELQAQVVELERRLSEAKADSLALRPGHKDYDAKLFALTQKTNAYQAQLEAARADVANEIDAMKVKITSELGNYIDANWHEVQALDTAIVKALLDVRAFVIERLAATTTMNERAAILDRYCHETEAGVRPRTSKTPWLADFPDTWGAALQLYISRFLKLAGNSGDAPQDDDLIAWFGKRV